MVAQLELAQRRMLSSDFIMSKLIFVLHNSFGVISCDKLTHPQHEQRTLPWKNSCVLNSFRFYFFLQFAGNTGAAWFEHNVVELYEMCAHQINISEDGIVELGTHPVHSIHFNCLALAFCLITSYSANVKPGIFPMTARGGCLPDQCGISSFFFGRTR